jgi:hypothetical protein
MSEMSDKDHEVMDRLNRFGLHPIPHPLGDEHHTDRPFTEEDKAIGDTLSYFLGTMYSDVGARYFHFERTSVDEWTRVARALRIHGLAIADRNVIEGAAWTEAQRFASTMEAGILSHKATRQE